MMVFADTSALFALLARNDRMHPAARAAFEHLARHDARLVTSSYVLVETIALLQRRIGVAAVRDFHAKIAPLLEIIWVDGAWHARAMHRLLMSGARDLSLVDCMSFEIIEAKALTYAFAFDKHFRAEGIPIVAPTDLPAEKDV